MNRMSDQQEFLDEEVLEQNREQPIELVADDYNQIGYQSIEHEDLSNNGVQMVNPKATEEPRVLKQS